MPEQIKITVTGAETVPLAKLEPFQGDLKSLEKEQYEKLRATIKKMGFSFTVHVWRNKGKNYIIDGHQRIKAVKMMVENEGVACPPIPVSLVKAKDFAEAKRKVLAGASQYGKVKDKGLFEFLQENDIPFDDVVANFDFPEIDFGDFGANFFPVQDQDPGNLAGAQANVDPNMKVGSDAVRQVQLFFDAKTHEEFMAKTSQLGAIFEKANVTDIVMECVRESYKANVKASQ